MIFTIPLIIIGDKSDIKTGKLLITALKKENCAEILYITENSASFYLDKHKVASLCIAEYDNMFADFSALDNSILLFKENIGAVRNILLPSHCYIIVGSDNFNALKILKHNHGKGNTIITCGMSVRDTFSLSANIGGAVSVSLQRKVRNIYGKTVGVCELPLKGSQSMSPFVITAFTALKVIIDL